MIYCRYRQSPSDLTLWSGGAGVYIRVSGSWPLLFCSFVVFSLMLLPCSPHLKHEEGNGRDHRQHVQSFQEYIHKAAPLSKRRPRSDFASLSMIPVQQEEGDPHGPPSPNHSMRMRAVGPIRPPRAPGRPEPAMPSALSAQPCPATKRRGDFSPLLPNGITLFRRREGSSPPRRPPCACWRQLPPRRWSGRSRRSPGPRPSRAGHPAPPGCAGRNGAAGPRRASPRLRC